MQRILWPPHPQTPPHQNPVGAGAAPGPSASYATGDKRKVYVCVAKTSCTLTICLMKKNREWNLKKKSLSVFCVLCKEPLCGLFVCVYVKKTIIVWPPPPPHQNPGGLSGLFCVFVCKKNHHWVVVCMTKNPSLCGHPPPPNQNRLNNDFWP